MTNVTDDFNRGDGGLGANWTDVAGNDALAISSQVVIGTANHSVAYWSANTFSDDQSSQITMGGAGLNNRFWGVTVRQQAGANSYYVGFANSNAANYQIYKVTAGSFSLVAGAGTGSVSNGDTLKLDVTGTTLTLTKNGSTVATGTDATFSSGFPGIDMISVGGTPSADDWIGGPIVVTTKVSLTSGLIGGRVLQGILA